MSNIKTTIFGYPRIGPNRELKKALESYWSCKSSKKELLDEGDRLIVEMAKKAIENEIDIVPCNEFSFYDFVLDVSLMVNAIPKRFRKIESTIDTLFAMARGTDNASPSEMTKWFNTNYHYIVPEIEKDTEFSLNENKPLREFALLKDKLKIKTKPVIVGPFTYLKISKVRKEHFENLFESLINVYLQIIKELSNAEAWVIQLDEPWLVMDLENWEAELLIEGYKKIYKNKPNLLIFVQTYYESLSKFEQIIHSLSVDGIGLDFVEGDENFENIKEFGFPNNKILIAGVVSGRDPWKINFTDTLKNLESLTNIVGNRLILSNASPLYHLPITVKSEEGFLPEDILNSLSFADEKIKELTLLKEALITGKISFQQKATAVFPLPDKSLDEIENSIRRRTPEFSVRYELQQKNLNLPLFPTTTIGSFPQTPELRKIRNKYKKGQINSSEYEQYIRKEIEKAVKLQENLGLDVLVHGEFERTDMVEFFAEQLDGFICTKNGWVQSYGSRCVRPPIIYDNIKRKAPITLKETLYAASLTRKPLKGILTGAVTILQWSFPRRDISRKEMVYQIALALREEVLDLEKEGIKIIQIDEPAFREGLPLKSHKHKDYFQWAIGSFHLTTSQVSPTTQIHTHMCYSDFNEIISEIYALDADVISIEASRSKAEILEAFENFKYDLGIGIGVYDIHSPRIPSVEEMTEMIDRAIKLLDKKLIWINPDCGLKTRTYYEIEGALRNMVIAAIRMREKFKN